MLRVKFISYLELVLFTCFTKEKQSLYKFKKHVTNKPCFAERGYRNIFCQSVEVKLLIYMDIYITFTFITGVILKHSGL